MSGAGENKRRFTRIRVEGVSGKMVLASHVEILNLSLGGVAIRADRRLNIGTEYTLRLETGERTVNVKGVVAWSVLTGIRASGEEGIPEYSAGLRFSDVLTDKLAGLLSFIDTHKVSDEQRLGGIRFQIQAPEKARLFGDDAYRVKLMSLSGMLIETDATLELEHAYRMEIFLPGYEPIHVSGRVASQIEVSDEAGEHQQIGIEFLDLSAEERQRLEVFLASVSGA